MWDSGIIIANNLPSADLKVIQSLEAAKIAIQEERYSDASKFIFEAKRLISKPKRKRR